MDAGGGDRVATEDDRLFPSPINLSKASDPQANHTLQRTGGTVAVPALWLPTQVGGGFTARR